MDISSYDPVDGSYAVVDDRNCDDDDDSYSSHSAYRWYYRGVRTGARVGYGTTVRPTKVTINTRSGRVIERGGFGFRIGSGG